MGRKALITEDDREAIRMAYYTVKKKNPKPKAEAVQAEAEKTTGRELGLSTVQRELVPLRAKDKSDAVIEDKDRDKNLDLPWSIGWVRQYPVDSSFIPVLVNIKEGWEHHPEPRTFTIRQALWCDKLRDVPTNPEYERKMVRAKRFSLKDAEDRVNMIVRVASLYAEWERWRERQGLKPDTHLFDARYLDEIYAKMGAYFEPKQNGGEGK